MSTIGFLGFGEVASRSGRSTTLELSQAFPGPPKNADEVAAALDRLLNGH